MKKNMISVILCLLLVASALLLPGCATQTLTAPIEIEPATQAPQEVDNADLLAEIQERGEIIIATEGTWSPWTFHDESDQLVGFDIEVAQKVAEKLGVTATFVEGEWDGLLAGLEAGRYDTMANGVEITEDRNEKYDFTDPYGYIRTAVIVRGDDESIQSFEDLSGKTTANTLASTYASLAESYGAVTTGVDDLNQTIELLLAGRVDATLNAEVTFYDYQKAHPESNLRIAALTDEASLVAFPVPKGEHTSTLRAAINQALAELAEEGVLTEISIKYFGNDITKNA
ncbi:MAG: transporter substrate-binding domain-containing protein [Eubacteriales bacterium]|nr:transporter substrate-binding domain-containing protein [Eubacteriales bacterium]